jgi:hypothetical protein
VRGRVRDRDPFSYSHVGITLDRQRYAHAHYVGMGLHCPFLLKRSVLEWSESIFESQCQVFHLFVLPMIQTISGVSPPLYIARGGGWLYERCHLS